MEAFEAWAKVHSYALDQASMGFAAGWDAALAQPEPAAREAAWVEITNDVQNSLSEVIERLDGSHRQDERQILVHASAKLNAALADISPAAAALLAQGEELERRFRLFLKRVIAVTKPYHENRNESEAAETLFDIYEDAVMLRAALAPGEPA